MQEAGAMIIAPRETIDSIDKIGGRPDRSSENPAQDIEQIGEEPLAPRAGKLDHEMKKNDRNKNDAGVT